MSESTEKVRTEMKEKLDHLRTLRDEMRVKAHLAKMDAKQYWVELEPRVNALVDEAERSSSEASRKVVDDTIHALEKLRSSI